LANPSPTASRFANLFNSLLSSADRVERTRCARVQVEPAVFHIVAHHVDAALVWVTVARGEFIESRDRAVALPAFALARGKDLLARGAFELIDAGLVDIKLALQAARLVGRVQHDRDPLPLRRPVGELARPEFIDAFR
jgi:hypothetical protein